MDSLPDEILVKIFKYLEVDIKKINRLSKRYQAGLEDLVKPVYVVINDIIIEPLDNQYELLFNYGLYENDNFIYEFLSNYPPYSKFLIK